MPQFCFDVTRERTNRSPRRHVRPNAKEWLCSNRVPVRAKCLHGLTPAPGLHLLHDPVNVVPDRVLREIQLRVGKNGIFLYNCRCSSESATIISASSTGFHSDRNLIPGEVEQLPQFADFIASHS
jgi:hypothetical protein